MPDEASMSFKVYLDLGGGRQEVRRFGLPETVATNYNVLREKVCSIFGLANQDAKLSWKDAEGDSITISSDDELMEAVADSLSKQNLQLVRIIVSTARRPEPGQSGPPGNQVGELHLCVTCDGCQGEVRGFRYRCMSCADFDLCGACETKGLHPEHKMIRLPKPRPHGAPWFFWKENEDPQGNFSTQYGVHGGDPKGGTFSSSASFSGGCNGAGGSGTWWGWSGPRSRNCYRRGHGARGRGGWPGWWGRNWGGRNWGGFGQCQTMTSDFGTQQQQQQQQSPPPPPPPQQQQQQQQQKQQQQQSQQQQERNRGCPSEDDCPWSGPEDGQCPFMPEESDMASPEQVAEEAKQMAEQVAHQAHQFASHYASEHLANIMKGIWTAWSGQQGQGGRPPTATASSSSSSSSSHSHSSSTSNAQNGTPREQKKEETGHDQNTPHTSGEEYLRNVGETVANMLDPLGIDVEVAVEHNGIRQRCSLGENVVQSPRSSTTPVSPSPSKEPKSSAGSVASGGSVNMEVQTEDPSRLQPASDRVEAMDVASPAPESLQSGVGRAEGQDASPEPEGWMLVNQEASQEPSQLGSKSKTPPAEKNVSYPSLQELQPHPDPKIQQALEQMSAMGYSNEGGWLTNLLEMKQGDINQVLDLLQPLTK